MGNYRSTPDTNKTCIESIDEWIKYGTCAMQGWRGRMEDFVYANTDLIDGAAMFAVFDGHNGSVVSEYCCTNMPDFIRKNWKPTNISETLKKSFCELDNSLKEKSILEVLQNEESKLLARTKFTKEDLLKEGKSVLRDLNLCHSSDEESQCDSQAKNEATSDEFLKNPNSEIGPNDGPSCSSDKGYHIFKDSQEVAITVNNLIEKVVAEVKDEENTPCFSADEARLTDEDSDTCEDESESIDEDEGQSADNNNDDDSVKGAETNEGDADEDDANKGSKKLTNEHYPSYKSGCTALVVIIYNEHLYVANAGDSRCVIGGIEGLITVSTQSYPTVPTEAVRILKAGGTLSDGRIAGDLNVSRGLGDHLYKDEDLIPEEQMVSPVPIVAVHKLTDDTQYIFLATDGLWDTADMKSLNNFFLVRLHNTPLSRICEELFDLNVAKELTPCEGGCDNMSCVLISWKPKDKHRPK